MTWIYNALELADMHMYLFIYNNSFLATCPMEGFNIGGVRKSLGIPKRYSIPLIVSTGLPFKREQERKDDVGMSHGPGSSLTKRYASEDVIFENEL